MPSGTFRPPRRIHVSVLKREISLARTSLIASKARSGEAAILIVWRSWNCHAGMNSSSRVSIVLTRDSGAGNAQAESHHEHAESNYGEALRARRHMQALDRLDDQNQSGRNDDETSVDDRGPEHITVIVAMSSSYRPGQVLLPNALRVTLDRIPQHRARHPLIVFSQETVQRFAIPLPDLAQHPPDCLVNQIV